jgi:hypothetical protein
MYEEEWYCSQEKQRPLGKSATRNSNLAAVTNRTLYVSLIDDVHTRQWVSTHCDTGQERVGRIARGNVWRGGIWNLGKAASG